MNCSERKYTIVSTCWLNNSMPSEFYLEAVSTSTLFSVKHKFLHLLLNLVRGGEFVVLIMDGRSSSHMDESMKYGERLWKHYAGEAIIVME